MMNYNESHLSTHRLKVATDDFSNNAKYNIGIILAACSESKPRCIKAAIERGYKGGHWLYISHDWQDGL